MATPNTAQAPSKFKRVLNMITKPFHKDEPEDIDALPLTPEEQDERARIWGHGGYGHRDVRRSQLGIHIYLTAASWLIVKRQAVLFEGEETHLQFRAAMQHAFTSPDYGKRITVEGTEEFCLKVWAYAQAYGIEVVGYTVPKHLLARAAQETQSIKHQRELDRQAHEEAQQRAQQQQGGNGVPHQAPPQPRMNAQPGNPPEAPPAVPPTVPPSTPPAPPPVTPTPGPEVPPSPGPEAPKGPGPTEAPAPTSPDSNPAPQEVPTGIPLEVPPQQTTSQNGVAEDIPYIDPQNPPPENPVWTMSRRTPPLLRPFLRKLNTEVEKEIPLGPCTWDTYHLGMRRSGGYRKELREYDIKRASLSAEERNAEYAKAIARYTAFYAKRAKRLCEKMLDNGYRYNLTDFSFEGLVEEKKTADMPPSGYPVAKAAADPIVPPPPGWVSEKRQRFDVEPAGDDKVVINGVEHPRAGKAASAEVRGAGTSTDSTTSGATVGKAAGGNATASNAAVDTAPDPAFVDRTDTATAATAAAQPAADAAPVPGSKPDPKPEAVAAKDANPNASPTPRPSPGPTPSEVKVPFSGESEISPVTMTPLDPLPGQEPDIREIFSDAGDDAAKPKEDASGPHVPRPAVGGPSLHP